jgi:hypothetical protein
MNKFLIVMFCLLLFNTANQLSNVGKDHPRVVKPVSTGVDFFALLVELGLAIWCGNLLFS